MLVHKHTEEFSAVPVIVFIGISSVLGAAGNSVVIYVYSRKYPKCNFKYFVLVLAGLDLISCVILMPLEIYTLIHWFGFEYSWLCKSKSFLNAYTVTASAAALLLIAIDRFRKVCKPHSRQITTDKAIKFTVLVLSLSLIPATSDAVFWGIHSFVNEQEGINITMRMCEKDDEFKNTIWPKLHTVVLYAGGNSILMLSTVVLYFLIGIKLFCVPTGPELVFPKITVLTPEDSGENGNEEKGNVFRFPIDTGVESGLSESEDLDKFSSVDLSDSRGDTTENTLDEPDGLTQDAVNEKETVTATELVPLRRKPATTLSLPPEKKVLRISIERINSESLPTSLNLSDRNSLQVPERNSLQIPDVVLRRPKAPRSPKSPVSPFKHGRNTHSPFHSRRSTLASLAGTTGIRLRRKTLIMFILTAVFVVTTVLYFCLIGLMSDDDDFLLYFDHTEQAVWLFFLRLYFINSVINPILYGFLDPRFRKSLWNMGVHIGFMAGSIKRSLTVAMRRRSSVGLSRQEMELVKSNMLSRLPLRSGSGTGEA